MVFCITYYIREGCYIFHTKDGEVQSNKDETVLPYIDIKKIQGVACVQTFRENFEGFSQKEITAAKLARESQVVIGCTSERDFESMVSNNMIQNWPITASDITSSHTIFGSNLAGTRGNTVRQNPDRVVMYYAALPKDFF